MDYTYKKAKFLKHLAVFLLTQVIFWILYFIFLDKNFYFTIFDLFSDQVSFPKVVLIASLIWAVVLAFQWFIVCVVLKRKDNVEKERVEQIKREQRAESVAKAKAIAQEEARKAELERDIEILKKTDGKEWVSRLVKENEILREKVDSLNKENESLKIKGKKLNNENTGFEQEVWKLREENNKLRQERIDMENYISRLRKIDLNRKQEDFSRLYEENRRLRRENDDLLSENDDLRMYKEKYFMSRHHQRKR